MVRKINKKVKENKISEKEIDTQIDKGLEFIYNYCGRKLYKIYYDLSLSTSLILTEVLIKIKEAYKIATINNNKKRNSLLFRFISHSEGLIRQYEQRYTPSPMMMAFYSLFIVNEYIGDYTGINYFKDAFKSDDFTNANEHQKLFIKSRYEKFKDECKNIHEERKYDIAFNKKYMDKFNELSMNLAKLLDILLRRTERYFPKNGVNKELDASINKFEFEIEGIEGIKDFQEYSFIDKTVKLTFYAKVVIENEYFAEYLNLLNPKDKQESVECLAMIKTLLAEIIDFVEDFSELAIYGEIQETLSVKKTA